MTGGCLHLHPYLYLYSYTGGGGGGGGGGDERCEGHCSKMTCTISQRGQET